MMVEEKLFNSIKGMIDLEADPPIACAWVDKIHNHGGKDKRLLLISDSSAYFLSKTAFSISLSISRHYYWFDLTDIKYVNDTNFHMFFASGDMNVQHKDAKVFLVVILTHLMSIFTKEERNKLSIDFTAFNFPNDFPCDFALRFRALSMAMCKKNEQKVSDFVAAIDNEKLYEIDLGQLEGNEEFLEPFLKSLIMAPYIKQITVPSLHFNKFWSIFANYISTSTNLKSIKVYQKLTPDFHQFCDAICRNEKLELESLSFDQVEFTPEFIDDLSAVVHTCGMPYITINNSMRPPTQRQLFARISQIEAFKTVRKLNLDNTHPLDIKSLFTACKNLRAVSLKNCDIQISEFLKLMGKTPDCRFENVNLSGNLCIKDISTEFTFPPTLEQLDLGNISWFKGAMQNIFKLCCSHKPKGAFHLVIQDAKQSDEQWKEFFESLSQNEGTCPLNSLVWDGNPLSEHFFDYIKNIGSLSALSISRILKYDDPMLPVVANFIRGNDSIRNLVLKGDAEHEIGMSITTILEALKINRALKIVDISFNKITAVGVLDLGNVLTINWVIEVISFDGAAVDSSAIYENFLSVLKKRGAPIDIVWPESDFEALTKKGIMSQEQLNNIKAGFQGLFQGNPAIPVPDGAYPHSVFHTSKSMFDLYFKTAMDEEDEEEGAIEETDDEEEDSSFMNIAFQQAQIVNHDEEVSPIIEPPEITPELSEILNLPHLPLFPSGEEDLNTDPFVLSKMDYEMPPLFAFPKFDDLLHDDVSVNSPNANMIGSLTASLTGSIQGNRFYQPEQGLEMELVSMSFEEWSLSLPCIPSINNDEVIDQLAGLYSMHRLRESLKGNMRKTVLC